MLPSFLSPSLAQTILVIGKSINFMRACFQRMAGKPSVASKQPSVKAALAEPEVETGRERVIRTTKSPKGKSRGSPMPRPSMANALAGNGDSSRDHTRNWEKISNGEVVKNDSIFSRDGDSDQQQTWSPFGLSEVIEIEESLQALRYGGELRLSDLVSKVSIDIDRKLLR